MGSDISKNILYGKISDDALSYFEYQINLIKNELRLGIVAEETGIVLNQLLTALEHGQPTDWQFFEQSLETYAKKHPFICSGCPIGWCRFCAPISPGDE